MIEHFVACIAVAEQIDQRNGVSLRSRQSADDKVEICCGEARPTIRLNHRKLVISTGSAICKPALTERAPRGSWMPDPQRDYSRKQTLKTEHRKTKRAAANGGS